jgi:hypothetical protein
MDGSYSPFCYFCGGLRTSSCFPLDYPFWGTHYNKVTSDYRPQFTANVWAAFCDMLSISHHQTTAYHPEASDTVEKLHHRLKGALRVRSAAATWAEEIPWILLGLHSQPREDTDLSPAEAVFGALFVLPN